VPSNPDTRNAQEQAYQSATDAGDTAVVPTGHAGRPQPTYAGRPTRSHNRPIRYLDSVGDVASSSQHCIVSEKACCAFRLVSTCSVIGVVEELSVVGSGCSIAKSVASCVDVLHRQRVCGPDNEGWRTVGSSGGKLLESRGDTPPPQLVGQSVWRPRTARE